MASFPPCAWYLLTTLQRELFPGGKFLTPGSFGASNPETETPVLNRPPAEWPGMQDGGTGTDFGSLDLFSHLGLSAAEGNEGNTITQPDHSFLSGDFNDPTSLVGPESLLDPRLPAGGQQHPR